MSKSTEVGSASQPQEGKRIRRGRLTGIITITKEGNRLIVWDDASHKEVSIDNVGSVKTQRFGSTVVDLNNGPKSY